MPSPGNSRRFDSHHRVVAITSENVVETRAHIFEYSVSPIDSYGPTGTSVASKSKHKDHNRTDVREPTSFRLYDPHETNKHDDAIDGLDSRIVPKVVKSNIEQSSIAPNSQRSLATMFLKLFNFQNTEVQIQKRWSFNIPIIHERIFWESYVEAERQKLKEQGYYYVQTFYQVITYLWKTHLQRLTTSGDYRMWPKETKEFWLFYFDRTKNIGISLFLLNVLSMTATFANLFIYYFTNYAEFNKFANQLRLSFVLYMMGWYLLNILCLACYLLFAWHNELQWLFTKQAVNNGDDVVAKYNVFFQFWVIVGRTVIATRYIIFIHIFVTSWVWRADSSVYKDVCLSLYMLPDDVHNFIYFVFIILFEIYQITVISFFPCPWPWILRVCFIEGLSTIWRIFSCSYLLGDFPNREGIVIGVCISVGVFYLFNVCMSTLTLMRTSTLQRRVK